MATSILSPNTQYEALREGAILRNTNRALLFQKRLSVANRPLPGRRLEQENQVREAEVRRKDIYQGNKEPRRL